MFTASLSPQGGTVTFTFRYDQPMPRAMHRVSDAHIEVRWNKKPFWRGLIADDHLPNNITRTAQTLDVSTANPNVPKGPGKKEFRLKWSFDGRRPGEDSGDGAGLDEFAEETVPSGG